MAKFCTFCEKPKSNVLKGENACSDCLRDLERDYSEPLFRKQKTKRYCRLCGSLCTASRYFVCEACNPYPDSEDKVWDGTDDMHDEGFWAETHKRIHEKRCVQCKHMKALSEFARNGSAKNCKVCSVRYKKKEKPADEVQSLSN